VIPVGLGLAFVGYTVGIWGYCLVRGYNVTFPELFQSEWGGGAKEGSLGSAKAAAA